MEYRKKNIAVFVKNLTSGGAEKQAVLLAKTLRYDYNVSFVIFHADKIHQKYLDMLAASPEVNVVKFYGSKITRFCQFVDFVRRNKIEAIFSYLTVASLLGSFVCTLCHVRGNFPGIRGAFLPKNKARAAKFFTNFMATQTVINSVSGKEYFVKYGCKKEKLEVILNCFENISPYKEKHHEGVVRYITVGRFMPQKDYLTAIKTMEYIRNLGADFKYTIVGYGQEEDNIRKWIEDYKLSDKVEIKINPDNISGLLDEADAYLCTSLYEGTSNAIMEAMNANLPIVATDAGDNFLLVKNKENGYIADIGDYKKLGEALVRLNDEKLRLQMGKMSKQILLDNYSVETFKTSYLNLLKRYGI